MSQEEQKEHNFLLNERNKIFAHSDLKPHELTLHTIQGSIGYFGNNVLYGYADDKIDISIKAINYFLSKILDKQKQIERLCPEAFN